MLKGIQEVITIMIALEDRLLLVARLDNHMKAP